MLTTEEKLKKLDLARRTLYEASEKIFEGMQHYQTALDLKGDFRFDLRESIRLQVERIMKAEMDLRREDLNEGSKDKQV